MGEIRITRLEPVHDPEAYDRVMRILGNGLRRGLLRLRQGESESDEALRSFVPEESTPT